MRRSGPLDMADLEPFYRSGEIGPYLQILKEARANRRIHEVLPVLAGGASNYTVFAPLFKLSFDPDVLVVSGTARQMDIVLRAMSYTTGQMYESKGTPVVGCAWTLVYPHLSGRINFSVLCLTFGHIAREVGKAGTVVASIPRGCPPWSRISMRWNGVARPH